MVTGLVIYLIFFAIFLGIWIWGCIRLFSNWEQFGDRKYGMLIAIIWLGPFGALWPICATPYPYLKYNTTVQYPVFV